MISSWKKLFYWVDYDKEIKFDEGKEHLWSVAIKWRQNSPSIWLYCWLREVLFYIPLSAAIHNDSLRHRHCGNLYVYGLWPVKWFWHQSLVAKVVITVTFISKVSIASYKHYIVTHSLEVDRPSKSVSLALWTADSYQ